MTNQSSKESLSLEFCEQLDSTMEMQLLQGINEYGRRQKEMPDIELFAVALKDDQGMSVGGLSGMLCYGCMHIDMLWIDPKARNEGWGKKIVEEAECQARKKGCTFSTLETMDWEALPFYQKLGYKIEFIRKGYEKNSTMYLLRKDYLSETLATQGRS